MGTTLWTGVRMKDGIMNVGMLERTAQWLNGRNGN